MTGIFYKQVFTIYVIIQTPHTLADWKTEALWPINKEFFSNTFQLLELCSNHTFGNVMRVKKAFIKLDCPNCTSWSQMACVVSNTRNICFVLQVPPKCTLELQILSKWKDPEKPGGFKYDAEVNDGEYIRFYGVNSCFNKPRVMQGSVSWTQSLSLWGQSSATWPCCLQDSVCSVCIGCNQL